MLRRIQLLILALLASAGLYAQVGTLNGTVIDASTNEPVPFANVSIEENGNVVTGGMTDFDGRFSIKPIKAGKYDVSASYIGYGTVKYSNVQITAGQITFQNFKLKPEAEMLAEVEVIEYKVPLIQKDQTQSGGTMTSEDISRMTARSADAVASTVGGVYSENGSVGSIRGSRSEDVVYYVDGVKVRGSSSVPKSAIEQVSVITGGVPAQYGDATGGIISLTTKGPASEFWGGAEILCSVEGYGYNLAGLTLSGPIWTKTDAETNRKRTIMGFMISAEGAYVLDGSPSAVGEWRAYDDVKEDMTTNPLRLVESDQGAVVYQNTLYLKDDSFYNKRRRSNATNKNLNIAAKIDIAPIRDLDITFGTNIYLADARIYSRSNSLFNSENNGRQKYGSYRMYGRLTQKFREKEDEEGEKKSFFRNPYYTIQVDYTKVHSQSGDINHWDNYFDYGYVGKFDISPNKFYSFAQDSVTGLSAYCMETFFYEVDNFEGGSLNPALANYTNQFYDYMGGSFSTMYTQYIQAYGGLLNGEVPNSIYGMWQVPGVSYGSYSKSDATQLRVSANASADLGGHEISLGFEFEQRSDSYFGVSPLGNQIGLWGLARKLTNSHIEEIDKTQPYVYRDDNGLFRDTIDYPRIYNASTQKRFDKHLREALGLAVDGTDWINIDSYDPSTFDLNWFSADELFNQGSTFVSYYGYDYAGNKLNYKPTFEDFFTKDVDGDGFLDRPIAPFEPTYMAGYIQDKFAFKDLIFNIGVRIDRYDANQSVLKDQYTLHNAYTVGNKEVDLINSTNHPGNIPDEAVVYVNDINNPTEITGYRVGSVWYNASGLEIDNPNSIQGANGISPYLVDPNEELNASAFRDYQPQVVVMPRIAFSFPISEDALFFAHYDILSQRPQTYDQLNPIEYMYIRQLGTTTLNNPDLKTEKTIDYELGFQQKLGNTSSIKLSAFYREMRDKLQTISVYGAYPITYYTLGNIDFGTVRGFTLAYDLRRTGNITLRANYTLQWAKGTGSSYESGASIVKSDNPNLRTILPLDVDQRHNFQIVLDYRFGGKADGTPYNGPKIRGKHILANTGVNFTIVSGSGTPYTKRNKPSQGVIEGSLNGATKPWRTKVDMSVSKDIRLRLAKAKDEGSKEKYGYLRISLEVTNLLNSKTPMYVYAYTGNAGDDGYLNYADYQTQIASQTDEEAFRNFYAMYINQPGYYMLPTTVRLGVSFSF